MAGSTGKVWHRCRVVLLGLVLVVLLLPGQVRAGSGPTMRFAHLTFEQGLSQNSALTLVQDRQGFMWFGTLDGLNRYDGYEFKVYKPDPDDPGAISDKFISALLEDSDGFLWVGTDQGGLNRFDPATETFTSFRADPKDPGSLSSNTITAIIEDSVGALWIGTNDGLNRFDRTTQTFTVYRPRPGDPRSLSFQSITAIVEDQDRALWVGTSDGLNRFEPETGEFTVYRHDPEKTGSLSSSWVRSLYRDRAGTLWVGTQGGGLNKYDSQAGTFSAYQAQPGDPQTLSENTVVALVEDRQGVLWAGTRNGLNKFDRTTEKFTAYYHEPASPSSLGSSTILSLYEDRSGILWVGTQGGGISRLTPLARTFSLYRHDPTDPTSLSSNFVWSIFEDSAGTLWVGTASGLNRFDPESEAFTVYRHDPADPTSLSYDVVTYILEDRTGRLWVATDNGLNIFDRETEKFTVYLNDPAAPTSLSSNAVGQLYEDRAGRLWIATLDGLNRFNPETNSFTAYKHDPEDPHSLSEYGAWAIVEDRAGNLWVGTGGGGLDKFDRATGKFTVFRHDPDDPYSLSGDIVISLYEDRAGVLWIGTFEGGLNKFDPATETFTAYTEKDGLPNSTIYGILEDDSACLWLSTINGLSRFDPASKTFKNYDIKDGLQSNEFSVRSYFESKAGQMFFGGIEGLTVFDPAQVTDNPFVPPVVLTAFHKFNEPLALEQSLQQLSEIDLSYQDYVISFEFAALDYTDPSENQYAYKLEGFDPDWVQAGSRRFASYTNLEGGNYVFRVQGSNNDGVWNEEGLAVRLKVATAPWKTWWAYLLYVLALSGIVLGYVRYRTRAQAQELEWQRHLNERLQQVDALKNEFLAHTSHELRTPLNGIIGLTESLIEGATGPLSRETQANLHMVVSSGRRLVSMVNNILDFSKLKHHDLILQPRPLDMYALTEVVLTLCEPLVGQKSLQLCNYIDPDVPLVHADENRVHQIMYNLVGNAIKFTESGTVEVSARVTDFSPSSLVTPIPEGRFLAVSVKDTGIGIPPERQESIFESFEQADEMTARAYGGTGLGLAITRRLVALHGGQIQVESTVGQGSQFTFTLPLLDEGRRQVWTADRLQLAAGTPTRASPAADLQAQGTAAAAHKPELETSYNILVVDDDPVNLQVLANQLTLEGYQVQRALSGVEALADIQGGLVPDLLILDVMMPLISGYEVCRLLRRRFTLSELPILILTAKNQVADLVAGLQAGANDYLLKPFDRRELLARVRTLLTLKLLTLNLRSEIDQRKEAQLALQKANEELELRVQARTAELVQVNEQLLQEVGERKQTEAELEQAVRDLDDFAHTVAHDLKGPIAIIIGYASLLEEEDEDRVVSTGHRQSVARSIITMGQKVDEIIQSLLLLASVHQEAIDIKPLNMQVTVSEAMLRLADMIDKYQAEIIRPSTWPVVAGYAPWIEEVWANYISNGLKYGGVPPRLELGATPQENGLVRFWVRDNGQGLPPGQLDQLFLPFRRFHRHQVEGHGLGLAIVRRIVEKLGGQVGAETSEHGSTFYFSLPAVDSSQLEQNGET